MQTETLLEKTIRLLKERPRDLSYAEIARHIKATAAWIAQVEDGSIPNPGIKNVQELHDYLLKVNHVI